MTAAISQPFSEWFEAKGGRAGTALEVDAVVIGSGYGGAVAALRLAEEGRRVVVLERGSEFQPGDFPNHAGLLPKFVRAHGPATTMGNPGGLFDFRIGQGMVSLVANGLGGGSLINAGVMMRPDEDVLAQPEWPAEIRHALDARQCTPGGEHLGLRAAFLRAQRMLGGEVFRDDVRPPHLPPVKPSPPGAVSGLPKAQALRRAGEAMRGGIAADAAHPDAALDLRAAPVRTTIRLRECVRCGDCFTGCNVEGAKKTLLTTYLARAHALRAELVTSSLVYALVPATNTRGGREWVVSVLPAEKEHHALRTADAVYRESFALRARVVVVAAGTFGSTELLTRSRQLHPRLTLSPALGTRLSGNGDSLSAIADLRAPVEGVGHGAEPGPEVGPTITTVLDLRGRAQLEQRVVLQDGAAPGALERLYRELLATAWTLRYLGHRAPVPRANAGKEPLAATRALGRHSQMLLAMGHDGSAGRLVWLPEMDKVVPYWEHPERIATFRRQRQLLDAAAAADGTHLHPPTWRVVDPELAAAAQGELPPSTMLSVHPLGGCPMGDTFETGVVNHCGQVWRGPGEVWDHLYVLDGSIVPTSLGCNPLWTITALAERAMAYRRLGSPPLRVPGAAGPLRHAPRQPRAVTRARPPVADLQLLERLERRHLRLRGALGRAMGLDAVEADIDVEMRCSDWDAAWEARAHRMDKVEGRLRLVEFAPERGPLPAPRRLEYRIVGGHVDLLRGEGAVLGFLARLWRYPKVWLTAAILRGADKTAATRAGDGALSWCTIERLMCMATEARHVRYDLRLELKSGPGGDRLRAAPPGPPPATLWLQGSKKITYAASWAQIAAHALEALQAWLNPCAPRPPRTLRDTLLEQLTCPTIRLDTARWHRWLPRRLVTSGRFDFDMQQALQRTPLKVFGGVDSTSAAAAAAAYPAFVARFLLQSRLLDFRLPTYSGRPVVDAASPEDVGLRVGPGLPLLQPAEFALPVRASVSSSDDGTEKPKDDMLSLRLWRYARNAPHPEWEDGTWCGQPVRRVKSVLLTHAFDMSGLSFTFKATARNLAEHFYAQGWEVWVLDSRMSSRTLAGIEPCTVDQLGFHDVPAAVDFILDRLRPEVGTGPHLQIFGFGQCMGAASFLIALLGGRLHHPVQADPAFVDPHHGLPRMPKLAGLVTSQTHPFIVGSRTAQAKRWVPAFVRDLAGRTAIPLGVRSPVRSVVESLADRLFAALPVPEGEQCPRHGAGAFEDDCATCRRIRFLLGGMYLHRNLNDATHRELPRFFGSGSIRLFAQGAKFFRYERLCSEDGFNVYVTEEKIRRWLALPLRFVHGAENDLFDKESALRSARKYLRIHPGWALRYGVAGTGQVSDVIEGYGHVDVLIGQHAMRRGPAGEPSVYDRLGALLDEAWAQPHAHPLLLRPPTQPPSRGLRAQFPKSGPFIGPVTTDANGRRTVGVSFVVDDTAEVHGAVALVQVRGKPKTMDWVDLPVEEMCVSVPARDDGMKVPPRGALIGLRVASARIDLARWAGQALHIRCVSYTWTDGGVQPPPTRAELGRMVTEAERRAKRLRREAARPFPDTLSEQRRYPRHHFTMLAKVPAHVLVEPQAAHAVRVAVGCCRYPGFPFERQRADEALRRVRERLASPGHELPPELLWMVGDQIYADRTAGLIDELSPVERFLFRHQEAFTTVETRKLLSRLPTVCVPDDHEFVEAYPLGRPLVRRAPERTPAQALAARRREQAAQAVAMRGVAAYQLAHLPAPARRQGWFALRRGRVAFFVLDTRSWRRVRPDGTVRTMQTAARNAFRQWVRDCAHDGVLACLVTGSVVLPGLHAGGDPANIGPVDTLQAAPQERAWLLGELAGNLAGRFVLLSGDYHVSFAGEVCLDGKRVGAAIVAPPFHAPLIYANARPEDLRLPERLATVAGEVTVRPLGTAAPRNGSGYGMLTFVPVDSGWEIRFGGELIDLEQGTGWSPVAWPAIALP